MDRAIFLIVPLFFILLFSPCSLPHVETEQQRKDYLIKVTGFDLPSVIKRGSVYVIPVKVYLGDISINWSICLASFKSQAFNVIGERCVNKENDSEEYEIYLPKNGYIRLENPEIVLGKTEKIIVNACYSYYNIFSLEGCVSKDRVCELKLTGVSPKITYINVESARVIYNPQNNIYYLRIYLHPLKEENVFIGSKDRDISKCYVEGFSGDYYNITYVLKYGTKNVSSNLILKPDKINQIDIDITKLGIDRDLPIAYFEFRIDYTVLQRVYLGSVRIEE